MIDVVVTGGRDFNDETLIKRTLDLFDIGHLVHGGCTGVDSLAEKYCKENKIPFTRMPANWLMHGIAAGPIRNAEMLERFPNAILIAFPGGKGTASCKREALNRKQLVLDVKKL